MDVFKLFSYLLQGAVEILVRALGHNFRFFSTDKVLNAGSFKFNVI